MGKLTIKGYFSIVMLNHQRVVQLSFCHIQVLRAGEMVNDLSTHEELESKAAQSTLEIMFKSELMFYYLIQWELF